jgi:secreted trypsin-like serine protease
MKLFLVALLVACARAELEDVDPFLTSGTLAIVGEFPSSVFIRSPGTPQQPLCGGTILDREHVRDSSSISSSIHSGTQLQLVIST